ncbi:hypothetical protein QYF36_024283 [Acer negundo]|nr:hypothetical protein QYF36_024283 [Acer negundo]
MKRSGNPSNKDDSRKLGPYYISGTTAGSFSSIGGNAILNIFRYLSFTGGRILDHITLPTKAAYSIALEERKGMPARRRPKKPKPNSDQPMKSSSPWKARELLMEEESPGCSDPYDHIGSIAEKVFLSWTRSQRTAIFLLRTQRLTKKMGNHPHEDQKTHSNALKSPKDLFRSSGSDQIRNRRIGTRGTK